MERSRPSRPGIRAMLSLSLAAAASLLLVPVPALGSTEPPGSPMNRGDRRRNPRPAPPRERTPSSAGEEAGEPGEDPAPDEAPETIIAPDPGFPSAAGNEADDEARQRLETALGAAGVDPSRDGILAFLRKEAKNEAAPAVAREKIAEWISGLGADDYGAREQAAEEIRTAGPQAVPLLEEARKGADPEIRARAEALLKEIAQASDREGLHDAVVSVLFDRGAEDLDAAVALADLWPRFQGKRRDLLIACVGQALEAARGKAPDAGVSRVLARLVEVVGSEKETEENRQDASQYLEGFSGRRLGMDADAWKNWLSDGAKPGRARNGKPPRHPGGDHGRAPSNAEVWCETCLREAAGKAFAQTAFLCPKGCGNEVVRYGSRFCDSCALKDGTCARCGKPRRELPQEPRGGEEEGEARGNGVPPRSRPAAPATREGGRFLCARCGKIVPAGEVSVIALQIYPPRDARFHTGCGGGVSPAPSSKDTPSAEPDPRGPGGGVNLKDPAPGKGLPPAGARGAESRAER